MAGRVPRDAAVMLTTLGKIAIALVVGLNGGLCWYFQGVSSGHFRERTLKRCFDWLLLYVTKLKQLQLYHPLSEPTFYDVDTASIG